MRQEYIQFTQMFGGPQLVEPAEESVFEDGDSLAEELCINSTYRPARTY